MYDESGFITNEELGIKFKYSGGSKRPYADTITGLIIQGDITEQKAKEIAEQFNGSKIYENKDERKGWWETYFSRIEKLDNGFHLYYVTPFND